LDIRYSIGAFIATVSDTSMAEKAAPTELLERFVREWNHGDDDRFNELMTTLLQHLHDFAWEVRLTEDEWLETMKFLTETGKLCADWRDEYQLLSDVLGLTTSMNEINHHVPDGFTDAAVLGPFHTEGSPSMPSGSSIIEEESPDGETALVLGRVVDENGDGIAGALLDIWQVAPNALYAIQDDKQESSNLRAIIATDSDGSYSFVTYKPPPYSIPRDGTVGRLLARANRHGMRPAHIHFIVSAEGYESVTTQLFTHDDPYIWSDAVFGEKESLLVEYRRNEHSGLGVDWILDYDFRLLDAGN